MVATPHMNVKLWRQKCRQPRWPFHTCTWSRGRKEAGSHGGHSTEAWRTIMRELSKISEGQLQRGLAFHSLVDVRHDLHDLQAGGAP